MSAVLREKTTPHLTTSIPGFVARILRHATSPALSIVAVKYYSNRRCFAIFCCFSFTSTLCVYISVMRKRNNSLNVEHDHSTTKTLLDTSPDLNYCNKRGEGVDETSVQFRLESDNTTGRQFRRNVDHFSEDFVVEPMGDKPVTALSGIGVDFGKKLKEQGFDKAFVVLGQFLLLRKDGELFTEWLKDTSGANTRNAAFCSQCLSEWCDTFLRLGICCSPMAC